MKKIMIGAVLCLVAAYGYSKLRHVDLADVGTSRSSWAAPAPSPSPAPAPAAPARYSCDGRTHCSHMRSCEEATYFIQNCPNTQMDGDNDGIPCERQWCG